MDWLKYFFLSFFVDEYGEEAHKRGLLNSVLSIFLSICILCYALFFGYCGAMPQNYRDSLVLREAAYSVLASGQTTLKHEGGRFSFVGSDGNEVVVNNFDSREKPLIIVDTRDTEALFIEFDIVYTDSDGNEISYIDYLALDPIKQENYTMEAKYTDTLIDFTDDRLSEYELFLSSVEKEEIAAGYSALREEKPSLDKNDYAIRLYELYVIAYYPSDVTALDIYSFAPTLRTYYDHLVSGSMDGEFLALFGDLLYVKFDNENTSYILSGHSENFDEGVIISPDSINDEKNLDNLIYEAFDHSKSYILIEYVFNLINALPIYIILTLIISLFSWAVFKLTKNRRMSEYLTSFKLLNLYSVYAALIAGIIGFVASASLGRAEAYKLSLLSFASVILLRLIIYLVIEIYKYLSESKSARAEAQE